jgi:hypothetical protein
MAKLLIGAGIVLIVLGVLVAWGVPLGRLPGDLSVRRGNLSFHFPIVTCILLSVVLTLLFRFFGR